MNSFPELAFNENLGGCKTFSFAPIPYFNNIPDALSGVIYDPIDFNSGFDWLTGFASHKSLSYIESAQETENGTEYKISISGVYPKNSADIVQIMHEMVGQRFVVMITDNNGVVQIFGTLTEPLSFSFRKQSGQTPQDRAGIDFEFSGIVSAPSPCYDITTTSPGS